MNRIDMLIRFTVIVTLLFFGFVICQSVYYDYINNEINECETDEHKINKTLNYTSDGHNKTNILKPYLEYNKNIYTTELDELVFEFGKKHPELKTVNISRSNTKGGCWYRLSKYNSNEPIGYDQFAYYNEEILWWNLSANDINAGRYKIYSFHGLYVSEYINGTRYYKPI